MLPLILCVLFFVGCSSGNPLDNCPAGLEKDDHLVFHGDACFRFVLDSPADYVTANADCKSHGGTLALVKSQDITDFLIDQLVYEFGNANVIWIGLSDRVHEGVFEWEDGTPLTVYTNWGTAQTNGTAQLKDCVYFDASKGGKWFEGYCSNLLWDLFVNERPFVCQYKARTVGTGTTASS